MPDTGYNHGKIRFLHDIKTIKDKESNHPKLLKECKKMFHWKCPL